MCLQINVINLSESYIFVHQTQFAHCALLVILKILSPLISILNESQLYIQLNNKTFLDSLYLHAFTVSLAQMYSAVFAMYLV